MKRDFSNSTREQLIEVIDNNRVDFYVGDVSGESLFACQEASAEDYSQFYDEIEECVKGANIDYGVTDGKINRLINEINTVFDAAQAKDTECAGIVEGNISLTSENYISDLKALASALDVSGPNSLSVDNLESLESGDMGSIFGDANEFEELLEDIDNPLYEEFLARFVTSSGTNYEEIAKFFAENGDDLSLWELQAFESILLSYVVVDPETGKLDDEALKELEKFLEACYYYVPYDGGGHEDYYVYLLHDEYAQIFAYYDSHVDAMLDAYEGTLDQTDPNWSIYAALSDIDALMEGIYLHGQMVEVSSFIEDEVNGGYLDETAPNVFDINITDSNAWMYIVFAGAVNGQINVSHFGPLVQSMIGSEYYSQQQQLVNPNDAYINALQEGVGDYVVSHLTGPLEDLVPEPIQEVLDVVEIFSDAEDAKEEQEQQNQQIYENMTWLTYLQLLGIANGSDEGGNLIACNGNVISCGTESGVTNHQFDENALSAYVDEYNSVNVTNIDAEIIIAGVTDPSCVDFTNTDVMDFLHIAQNQGDE